MSKEREVLKEGLGLLNELTTNYLQDETNFLIFEETVFPGLPGKNINRQTFRNFRNVLAQRVSKAPPVNPVAQLESLNSSVITQQQTQQLEKLQTNDFALRRKIDDLSRTVGNLQLDIDIKFENLSDNLDDKLNNINNKLDRILHILNTLESLEEKITDFLNLKFKNLYTKIDNSLYELYQDITKFLIELSNTFEVFIRDNLREIINAVEVLLKDFIKEIDKKLKNLLKKINEKTESTRLNLRTYIFDQLLDQTVNLQDSFLLTLTAELKTQSILIISRITGRLIFSIGEVQANMNLNRFFVESKIELLKESLETFFIMLQNPTITSVFNTWYDDKKDESFKSLSNYVCERIVGESYIKYDSNYMYMPTIILRYKTKNILDYKKYSQIKLRLNYKTEEIDDVLVKNLKSKIKNISLITYFCGNLRCNYVGENRLFKTTVFSNSKKTVLNLFENLISLTNTKYLKDNFSFTENSKRNHGLRRQHKLNNIEINKQNDFSEVEMCLSSAYLQVNGLERQIKLF